MEKQQIKPLYPQIKEMYLGGVPVLEIARILNISKGAIHNAISNMYLPRRNDRRKSDAYAEIDESGLVYADNSVKIEKVDIYGKIYTDVTPIYAPR